MVASGTAGGPAPESLRRSDETLEPLLLDQGHILQKRRGYRFSLDAILLADFALRGGGGRRGSKRCLDLGTGCGIVPILLARADSRFSGYGVEIQHDLADMAARNLKLQGLEDRLQILCADLKDVPSRLPRASFDWITTNPPYRRLDAGRRNPDRQKALARHEVAASLPDICAVMGRLLRVKGRGFWIYPASRLAGLLSELRRAGLEPKRMRPVYPKPGEQATWVLVEAIRGSKEGLVVQAPLVVEDGEGAYSEEVQAVFRWEG